jgi:hypothetical protein
VATTVETRTPPYLPSKTLFGFFDALKETAVPHRIDNSIMSKYSGSTRTQIRTALRFFGLTDDSGIVTADFRDLVAARGTAKWRTEWEKLFFPAYNDIINDLDIDTGTLQQLKERFRASNVDGSVLIKSVRFYLAGLEETGATFSPHFKQRGLSTGVNVGKKKPKVKPTNGSNGATPSGTDATAGGQADVVPKGSQRFALPLKGRESAAVLIVPTDMKQTEWEMLDFYIRSFFGFTSREGQV